MEGKSGEEKIDNKKSKIVNGERGERRTRLPPLFFNLLCLFIFISSLPSASFLSLSLSLSLSPSLFCRARASPSRKMATRDQTMCLLTWSLSSSTSRTPGSVARWGGEKRDQKEEGEEKRGDEMIREIRRREKDRRDERIKEEDTGEGNKRKREEGTERREDVQKKEKKICEQQNR